MALIAGVILALTLGNPFTEVTQKWASALLKASVVGLGFGLDLNNVLSTSIDNLWLTIFTIVIALAAGLLLGKIMRIEMNLSILISTGTAICGGSAIASMSPVIRAKQEQILVAISIVFILNAIALYIFPLIGNYLNLTQEQFGLWAALGIHDTSSVVGAASLYGEEALNIATTAKLARALWIIPLVIAAIFYMKRQNINKENSIRLPYFILLFVLASACSTFMTSTQTIAPHLVQLAKIGLVLSLLFMGAGITKKTIKNLDSKPLIQAVILWLLISSISLLLILFR